MNVRVAGKTIQHAHAMFARCIPQTMAKYYNIGRDAGLSNLLL